jgi:TonB family protein
MKVFAILGLTLAIAAAPPAAKPVGPWVVDFETTHCIASRQFDAGGVPIIFGIEAIPTQEGRHLYFQRPGKSRLMDLEEVDIRIGGKRIEKVLIAEPVVEKGNVRYSTTLEPEEYGALLDQNALSARSHPIKADLRLTSLKVVDSQLANCASMMLEYLGVSRDQQGKIASFPKFSKAGKAKIGGGGYPQDAQRRGAMGSVRLMVMVNEAGKVTDCRRIRSSGHPDLDADACSAMRTRAVFDPARDRQGRAIASLYVTDFSYLFF